MDIRLPAFGDREGVSLSLPRPSSGSEERSLLDEIQEFGNKRIDNISPWDVLYFPDFFSSYLKEHIIRNERDSFPGQSSQFGELIVRYAESKLDAINELFNKQLSHTDVVMLLIVYHNPLICITSLYQKVRKFKAFTGIRGLWIKNSSEGLDYSRDTLAAMRLIRLATKGEIREAKRKKPLGCDIHKLKGGKNSKKFKNLMLNKRLETGLRELEELGRYYLDLDKHMRTLDVPQQIELSSKLFENRYVEPNEQGWLPPGY